jgi:hypothetical protein
MKKVTMIAIAALVLMAPLAASARVGVFVAPRIGWGWYAPVWGAYPYPYYGYYPAPVTGDVKFDTHDKQAQVYIDGAYAGTVGQVKTMHLHPGSYDIEVRGKAGTDFNEKVYIAAGKTLHLNPDAEPQE